MNRFPFFFVLVYVFLLVTGAPTSSTPSSFSIHISSIHNSSSTGISTTSTSHKTQSTRTPSQIPPQIPPHIPAGPPTQHPPVISRPGVPTISHTHSIIPDPPLHTGSPVQANHHSGQQPIAIVFEVLGGLAASALLLGFIRCLHNYRKTPGRDRIADILHRHQLQRELEELERNPGRLRRHPSVREPAPPYFPRPPSYEQVLPSLPPVSIARRDHPPQATDRAQYSPVATYSPPSTPPMNERILLPTPAVTPGTHPGQPT